MRHYEQFIRMLNTANIRYKLNVARGRKQVTIAVGAGPHNEGVGGLYSVYTFNEHDELEGVCMWEDCELAA